MGYFLTTKSEVKVIGVIFLLLLSHLMSSFELVVIILLVVGVVIADSIATSFTKKKVRFFVKTIDLERIYLKVIPVVLVRNSLRLLLQLLLGHQRLLRLRLHLLLLHLWLHRELHHLHLRPRLMEL